MRDHRKLDVFHLADDLVLRTYELTSCFPFEERFGLSRQMRRCAVSAAANVVEGCARATTREYARFLEISLGSVRELGYYIDLARRLSYVKDDAAAEIATQQARTAAALASLIRALRA